MSEKVTEVGCFYERPSLASSASHMSARYGVTMRLRSDAPGGTALMVGGPAQCADVTARGSVAAELRLAACDVVAPTGQVE